MNRRPTRRHLLPLGILAFFTLAQFALGQGQIILGLVCIAPLTAATIVSRRATAAYGGAALAVALLLGLHEDQYRPDTLPSMLVRLAAVVACSLLAMGTVALRLRREALLTRLSAEAAESRAAVELAESLQRALLTDPPPVPGLQIAVRYLPAVKNAQVGGDWYDAFPLPDGATMLVIGDVAGHDVAAAATMAQARGVLRGIALTVPSGSGDVSPAAVLRALDGALGRLELDSLVTGVTATASPSPGSAGALLRWSNAGHPAPVHVTAAGRAELLDRPAELLLGISPAAPRTDHELVLAPGDTLVLYTDGLIERRDAALDAGTAWLVEQLGRLADQPLEQLCDALVAGMSGRLDDDVAVLAVRVNG
ncbi:PP2C family protein-serine/threonine phosphatase [Modestobacter roseus]|uniref:Serine phosphatase RsbU (Regulator of sigma subunit) n=1 Tax=Modestobacter roseus TaxID=1181884 RepID=A0A562IPQ0_9ACTN|nr:PP2C family protein-serine/threonine phosphatase [Modestobacter roseus]TWH72882.1 serine phosphatase RsbU (regulator of sigma subunit) [Modestobacter roseus]